MAIFLFFGDDTFSQRAKIVHWRKEFEKKYGGDMNIVQFAGGDAGAQEIFQACAAMPFLAEKRLTIVKNFLSEARAEEQGSLAELLEKIPDFCTLVFSETGTIDRRTTLYKKLNKIGTLTEFSAMTGSKLLGWIEKTVTAKGGAIEKEALLYLAEVVPADLYRLENEIAKLVAYTAGGAEAADVSSAETGAQHEAHPIIKRDIELLVDTQLTASIFRLTDGIGQKNRRLALDTLHTLIDMGEELPRILYMIMRQFRIITSVKDLAGQGMRQNEIAAKIKEHPFVVSNTMSQARNFTLEQLKRAYSLLIEIDTRLKSGGIRVLKGDNREFVLALDRLVLDLCA